MRLVALALWAYATVGMFAGLYVVMIMCERDDNAFKSWRQIGEFVMSYVVLWVPILLSGKYDVRDGL